MSKLFRILVIVSVFAGCKSSTAPTTTPPIIPAHLLCKYDFSGNVIDSSGNGHNGTRHGCTFVNDRFGKPMNAMQFNGTTDYVSVPDSSDLNFGKSDNFTMSFWVNFTTDPSWGGDVVLKKGTTVGSAFTGYDVVANSGAGFDAEVGTTYGDVTATTYPNYVPVDSRWHFVVITFAREAGGITFVLDDKMYVDGGGGRTAMQGNINTTAPLLIGGDGTLKGGFKGILDDFRIYNGMLSFAEIDAMYHANGW